MNDERINALRRQQALGVLGQMGGANVGQFGQALSSDAAGQMDQMREDEQLQYAKQQQGLDNALKVYELQSKMGPDWVIKADPVHGGLIAVDKNNIDNQRRISMPGAAGAGGVLPGEDLGLVAGTGKPSSEQERTGYNMDRLTGALGDIDYAIQMGGEGVVSPNVLESVLREKGYSGLANAVSDEWRQVAHAAWADSLDALLWLSTGAAYNEEQKQTIKEAAIPGWNDSPELLEFKLNRLMRAIMAGARRTGRALTQPQIDAINQVSKRIYGKPGMGKFDPVTGQAGSGSSRGSESGDPPPGSVRPRIR